MSTNENYNNQEYHHMTKEELLDYLVSNMIEDNGVYKILVNRKEIENDPQLYHLYFRKDLKTMEFINSRRRKNDPCKISTGNCAG